MDRAAASGGDTLHDPRGDGCAGASDGGVSGGPGMWICCLRHASWGWGPSCSIGFVAKLREKGVPGLHAQPMSINPAIIALLKRAGFSPDAFPQAHRVRACGPRGDRGADVGAAGVGSGGKPKAETPKAEMKTSERRGVDSFQFVSCGKDGRGALTAPPLFGLPLWSSPPPRRGVKIRERARRTGTGAPNKAHSPWRPTQDTPLGPPLREGGKERVGIRGEGERNTEGGCGAERKMLGWRRFGRVGLGRVAGVILLFVDWST